MAYPEDKTEQTKSIILTNVTPNISAHVIKKIKELDHPYSRSILQKAGAVQAVTELWPVLCLPMEGGDFHCVKYENYHDEPPYDFRFVSCKMEDDKKKKGRPKKTRLGLIGVNKKTSDGPMIWITEGFWDYLTLLEAGYPVWAVPGARNLLPDWVKHFKNKDIIICFDNDSEGEKWAQEHAKKLGLVAKSVKILDLPSSFNGTSSKDISDLRREFGGDKKSLQDYLKELVDRTAPFDFPVIDKIKEIILNKGTSIVKAEIITQMIIDDLQKSSGHVLPFNDGQELAIIMKGKDILADRAIDTMLCNKYNFLPTLDVWKSVRGLLYNHALRDHGSVNIHTYSTFENGELHFGLKGKGILSLSPKGYTYDLQGKNGIFIKSPNRIDLNACPENPTVSSIEDLLNVLKFDEDILSQEEQVHLIKVWFYNTFFNFDTMQPILCAIGESGSGKSQLFKFLKGILFGFGHKRNYMLNIIPEDDHERSLLLKGKKYLFFDEVNENSPKIKKFLRTMATGIEETFRPKYERHNIEFIPDAWLAINGLNLVSSREYDIAKRLCLVKLEPLSTQALTAKFGPEYIMYQKLNDARPAIWKSMLKEIKKVLGQMEKHKGEYIHLDSPCRFMGLANFAWQAWPDRKTRKITHSLFSKMEGLQSHHSADMDPMMDIIEEWVETEAINHANPEEESMTLSIKTKTMFRELQPLAREHGVKYFPKSERALGQWFSKREVVLYDAVGYERIKNLGTKNFEHRFKVPEKEGF